MAKRRGRFEGRDAKKLSPLSGEGCALNGVKQDPFVFIVPTKFAISRLIAMNVVNKIAYDVVTQYVRNGVDFNFSLFAQIIFERYLGVSEGLNCLIYGDIVLRYILRF